MQREALFHQFVTSNNATESGYLWLCLGNLLLQQLRHHHLVNKPSQDRNYEIVKDTITINIECKFLTKALPSHHR